MPFPDDNPVGEAGNKAASGLGKRIGPLPVWGWGIAIAAGLLIALKIKSAQGSGASSATPQTPPTFAPSPINTGSGSGGGLQPSVAPLPQPATDTSSSASTVQSLLDAALSAIRNAGGGSGVAQQAPQPNNNNGAQAPASRAPSVIPPVTIAGGTTKYLYQGQPFGGNGSLIDSSLASGAPLAPGVTVNPNYTGA